MNHIVLRMNPAFAIRNLDRRLMEEIETYRLLGKYFPSAFGTYQMMTLGGEESFFFWMAVGFAAGTDKRYAQRLSNPSQQCSTAGN